MSQKNFSRIKEKLIQLKGKSLRNSLFIWLYVLLVSFAVQVVVLGMTKFSLYNEGEYLFYPENWLVSIKSNHQIANVYSVQRSQNSGGMIVESIPLNIKYYRVKRGDTLSGIAEKFGLNLDTVASMNRNAGVGVHLISIDELIRIPNQDGIYLSAGKDFENFSLQKGLLPETVLRINRATLNSISSDSKLFFPGIQHSGRELSLAIGMAFQKPVDGWISSGYGIRIDPFSGKERFHRGVDIAANKGAVVSATQGGKVVAAGWQNYLGNYIIISHYVANYSSVYGHLHSFAVNRGDLVNRGQQIGTVGSTGKSTGPHLHFEIRRYNNQLDPEKLIMGL